MKSRLPAIHAPNQCRACKHPGGHWATCKWHPENIAIVRKQLHLKAFRDGGARGASGVCTDPDAIEAALALRPAGTPMLTVGTTEPDPPMGTAPGCEHEGHTAHWDEARGQTVCDNCDGHVAALDEDAEDEHIVRELERESDGHERDALPLGQGVELMPQSTTVLTGYPDLPFEVHHFVTPMKGARVESIKVGTVEQMVCAGAVPSECFAPGGPATKLKGDTAIPGVSISVTITNPTDRPMRAGGMMVGNVMRRSWNVAPELARIRKANRRILAVRGGDPNLADDLDDFFLDGELDDSGEP